jgi:hypothetical protein
MDVRAGCSCSRSGLMNDRSKSRGARRLKAGALTRSGRAALMPIPKIARHTDGCTRGEPAIFAISCNHRCGVLTYCDQSLIPPKPANLDQSGSLSQSVGHLARRLEGRSDLAEGIEPPRERQVRAVVRAPFWDDSGSVVRADRHSNVCRFPALDTATDEPAFTDDSREAKASCRRQPHHRVAAQMQT